MIFAAGQPGVAVRPADDELARGVDVEDQVVVDERRPGARAGGGARARRPRSARSSRRSSCCVERTTVWMRRTVVRSSSYSTVTWLFASGRRYGIEPASPFRIVGELADEPVREREGERHQLVGLAARRSRTSSPGRRRPGPRGARRPRRRPARCRGSARGWT